MNNSKLVLRDSVVRRFWEEKNRQFAELAKRVDEQEFWCVDDDKDVQQSLLDLSNAFENEEVTAENILKQETEFLLFNVLAYVKFSKAIRLIQWFEERFKENISEKLVEKATKNKEDSYYRLFLERLLLIKNYSSLNQIYSKKRCEKIKKIIEKVNLE